MTMTVLIFDLQTISSQICINTISIVWAKTMFIILLETQNYPQTTRDLKLACLECGTGQCFCLCRQLSETV